MVLRSGFVAVLALLIAAAPAMAVTSVRSEGGTLYVDAAAGDVSKMFVGPNSNEGSCGNPFLNPCGWFEIRDFGAGVQKGAGCTGSPTVHLCAGPDVMNVQITLLDGNDELTAGREGRTFRIDAGTGDDEVYTGSSPDTVILGEGNDLADVREGTDSVDAGPGDDSIDSRDFRLKPEADSVNCGPGNDVAYADSLDSLEGCERVLVAGTGPAMAVDVPARLKVGSFLRKGLEIDVEVDDGCDVGAALTLAKKTARKFKVIRGIAKAKGKVADDRIGTEKGTLKLKLKPSKKIADKLAGAQQLKGELEVICKTGRGRTVAARALTFKK